MPMFPASHEGSLIPLLAGLVPKVAGFLGGLIRGPVGPTVARALAPVGRAIAVGGRQLARAPVGRALALGGAVGVGQELVQRGFKITINRRTG